MIIGFTGTRDGMTKPQEIYFKKILEGKNVTEFHHGDCIGADAKAHKIVLELNIPIIIHPPFSSKNRAFCKDAIRIMESDDYLVRNKNIVNACEELIVIPKDYSEVLRSGTWSTMRYAQLMRKLVTIIYPDGVLEFRP